MDKSQDLLPVTQADRDAAARAVGHADHNAMVKAGNATQIDLAYNLSGHFADYRHRLAQTSPTEAVEAQVGRHRRISEALLNARDRDGDEVLRHHNWLSREAQAESLADAVLGLSATNQQTRDDGNPIIAEIIAEVEKATLKFPTWPTRIIDAGNVVSEEAGELAKSCLQVTYEKHKETLAGVRMEAIQTAAMCVRFLASMDRYDCSPGEQHEQPSLLTTPTKGGDK